MEGMKALDDEGKGRNYNRSSSSASIVRSKSGERRWVVYINDIIEKEVNTKTKTDISSSIFIVPKFLSAAKPQDYAPQFLALGPYHHFSRDLYDMERYKLVLAMHQNKFQSFVSQLSKLDLQIRASYHRRLDLDADTLALLMAIDGLFLLELLSSQVRNHDLLGPLNEFVVLSSGRRLSNDVVLRDILKLENQIPFVVLREIFGMIQSETMVVGFDADLFSSILVDFCLEISPLNLIDVVGRPRRVVIDRCAHVLDLLYRMITSSPENDLEAGSAADGVEKELPGKIQMNSSTDNCVDSGRTLKGSNLLVSNPWKLLLNCLKMLRAVKKVFEFVQRLLELLPLVGGLVSSAEEYSGDDGKSIEVSIEDKTPLMEAGIKVPTATELFDTGVRFKATGSIKTIKFEAETASLYLPVITLGVNSEVIFRNLVAYEAMAMPDCLLFSRYLHLMNSLIDTAEDVKILTDAKIVASGLKKDQEIAVLFNGLMRNNYNNIYSIGLSPAKELDQAINGVNKYYEGRPKVKASRIIQKYVYSSWRILTLLATLLILGLLVLQSFCSVYNCPHMFGTVDVGGENS